MQTKTMITTYYLNLIRFKSLPPRGKDTKVISTPGSTCATHSLGSFSSSNTIGSGLRPLAEADNVPTDTSPPTDIPFSLASISFPQTLPELEFLLPVRLYGHRNLSDTDVDKSGSGPLLFCNCCCGVIIAAPVHGLHPEAFSVISFICNINSIISINTETFNPQNVMYRNGRHMSLRLPSNFENYWSV